MADLTKPVRVVDPKYRSWVQSYPCIFCVLDGLKYPKTPSQCCHAHAGGVGTKCSDRRTFPACYWHHVEYDAGREHMLKKYPTLDLEVAMDNLNEQYEQHPKNLNDEEIF